VKKVNQDGTQNQIVKEYHYHRKSNIFQAHPVHLVHLAYQELKVIWVRLDIMVLVKLDHLAKMYVIFIHSYFIHFSIFFLLFFRVYPARRYVKMRI
jgi:hypothetical protein